MLHNNTTITTLYPLNEKKNQNKKTPQKLQESPLQPQDTRTSELEEESPLTCLDMFQRNLCYAVSRDTHCFFLVVQVQKPISLKPPHCHACPPGLSAAPRQLAASHLAWEKPPWNVLKRLGSSNKQASSSAGMCPGR